MSKKYAPTPIRRVCLIVLSHAACGQRVIEGVIDYLTQRREWDLRLVRAVSHWHILESLSDCDGVIVEMRHFDEVAHYDGPIVRVLGDPDDPPTPAVMPDNATVGRMAATHFLDELQYTHLGFCGAMTRPYAKARLAGFRETAAARGLTVHVPATEGNPLLDKDSLGRWLVQLPKPIGIFVPTDHDAVTVSQVCRQMHLMVPEQVALLGVDNDQTLCRATTPPLSSIDQGAFRIGHEAAAMLDLLMKGQPVPEPRMVVPPVGLIQRQSTDTLAVDNIDVARAVRFIRDNAIEDIKVQDVCDAIPAARRTLELIFKQALGRTIHQEIHRVRLARALELLAWTDMPIADICARSGFSYPTRLATVLREETGQTPREYRRKHRSR